MRKKATITALIIFSIFFYQLVPAHAGYFSGSQNTTTNKTAELPPHTSPPTHSVLKYGMQNSQIITVQQYLIKANYLSDRPDGVFGYQTLQAIKAFQADSGLPVDGVVGPKTLDTLKNFKGSKPHNQPAYLYALPVLATAYTRYDKGCTDYTYRGTYLRRGLIAVDPDVIPLGTRLYIPGYGEGIADDIGGAIQGNHIDLAMDTLDEAFTWGTRKVTVYVLNQA